MILSDLLEMLPKSLVNYYSANDNAFWIRTLNSCLAEIERIGVRPERLDRFLIPNPSGTIFKPHPDCRYIRDVEYNGYQVKFEMRGEYAVITDDVWLPQSGTVWTSNPASNIMNWAGGYFTIAASTNNASTAVGRMVRIQGIDDDGFTLDWSALITKITAFSGPTIWNVEVDVPDLPHITNFSVNVYDDFIETIGDRRFSVVSTVQPIPMGDEWRQLLTAGLRYYGEMRLDETSNTVKVWSYEWERTKKEYVKAGSQARGQVGTIKRNINFTMGSRR
jgi:hypothetical protein